MGAGIFVRAWRYTAKPGRELEFESFYGPAGPWVELFRRAPGYRSTELLRSDDGGYETIDRWESRAEWDAFRSEFEREYDELDRQGERLTDVEQAVSEGEG